MQQLLDIALTVLPDHWKVHLKRVIAETWYRVQAIQLPVINASLFQVSTSIQARQKSYRVSSPSPIPLPLLLQVHHQQRHQAGLSCLVTL